MFTVIISKLNFKIKLLSFLILIKTIMKISKTLSFITTTTIIILLFVTVECYSQFYIGASIGNSFINKDLTDLNGDDFKIDENSFGYKIFGGFGSKFIGGEGGYRDLGTVSSSDGSDNLSSKITGWDVAARGRVSIGPVFVSAKAGVFFAKAKNEINQREFTNNSTNFLWGLGAGVKLGLLGLRLEWESLDMSSDSKLSMLTLGATVHFGGK